ncbi:MAG: hypothetical protein DRO18_01885 [Thermoprotei archaeon]|nr:MAG: hypothetical protein DRO18_01885 [Thermoprotei archaeon]
MRGLGFEYPGMPKELKLLNTAVIEDGTEVTKLLNEFNVVGFVIIAYAWYPNIIKVSDVKIYTQN